MLLRQHESENSHHSLSSLKLFPTDTFKATALSFTSSNTRNLGEEGAGGKKGSRKGYT